MPLRVVTVTSPEEVDDARDMSVAASQREIEAATAFERGDRARALELNARSQAELEVVKKAAPAKVAAELDAQQRAYSAHQGTFATAPAGAAAAPVARDIGAKERKNSDRALSY